MVLLKIKLQYKLHKKSTNQVGLNLKWTNLKMSVIFWRVGKVCLQSSWFHRVDRLSISKASDCLVNFRVNSVNHHLRLTRLKIKVLKICAKRTDSFYLLHMEQSLFRKTMILRIWENQFIRNNNLTIQCYPKIIQSLLVKDHLDLI